MRTTKFLVAITVVAAVLVSVSVHAGVTISSKPTQNMTCSGGVCTPTAPKAVLNATDLANMLATSDVKVTTSSGATNIVVKDTLGWTSASRLTLDATQSVEFDKPVTVAGTGAVTIATNDGGKNGDLLFDGKGSLIFWDTNSSLVINGHSYMLVKKLKDLKAAIRNNPTGFFALAGNYNAQKDGTYSRAVITTVGSSQTVEGLGNQIQNLTISNTGHPVLALINDNRGTIRDLGLQNVNINSQISGAAGLVYVNEAMIQNCFVSGTVHGGLGAGGLANQNAGVISHSHASATVGGGGGLVAVNGGTVETSYATGSVTGGGGLVGENFGAISESFATGAVTGSTAGGLVGANQSQSGYGTISNSYSMGAVTANSMGGGLAGANYSGAIEDSYSTGLVGGSGFALGGFVGDVESDSNTDDYWDLDTSGISNPHQGAGDFPDDPGITGLTDDELKSGLPAGFNPRIWAQNPKINGGYPYLRAVSPS